MSGEKPRTRRPARAPQLRLQERVLVLLGPPVMAKVVVVVVEAVVQSLNGQPGPNGRSDTEFRHPIAFLQEPMMNLKRRAN